MLSIDILSIFTRNRQKYQKTEQIANSCSSPRFARKTSKSFHAESKGCERDAQWPACAPHSRMHNCVRVTASRAIVGFSHSVNAPALDGLIAELGRGAEFAVVAALTATAKDIERAESQGLADSLDRPTPFTLQAFGTEAATKAKPQARVYMRPIQSRYLQWQIDGGARSLKGFELRIKGKAVQAYAVPGTDVALDQYGNVSRSTITEIIRQLERRPSDYFVGQPNGRPDLPAGVYKRTGIRAKQDEGLGGGGYRIKPVFVFVSSAQYLQMFDWSGIANLTASYRFERNLAESLARY